MRSLNSAAISHSEQITGPLGQVHIAGFSPLGVDVFNFPQKRANNTFQVADGITHVSGKHILTGGFDIRRIEIKSTLDRNARPLAAFGGLRNPGGPMPLVQACSDCVLPQEIFSGVTLAAAGVPTGLFQTLSANSDATLAVRFHELNFFFQDAFRLTPHLMVTAGLRYELNTVPGTVGRKLESAFDREALVARAQQVEALCPARCADLAASFQRMPDYAVTFGSDPHAIHPRLGFAWSPAFAPKVAIRGGFGMYSSPSPGVVINQSRSAFPNFVPLNLTNFPQSSSTAPLLFNLASSELRERNPHLQIIQVGTLNRLRGSDAVKLVALDLYGLRGVLSPTFPALDLVLPAKDLRNPRSFQFGLTIETELTGGFTGSVAYVGTSGVHLFRVTTPQGGLQRNVVQFSSEVLPVVARSAASGDTVFPFFNGVMRLPQQERISNAFTFAPTFFESSANSRYHSLQIEVSRKAARRLQFGTAFTYSHSIDDASDFFDTAGSFALPQNSFRSSERGSSGFDARLRSVTHLVWDLTRGWQVSGILTAQTGQPFTINSSVDVNRDGNLTDRLNNIEGLVVGETHERRVVIRPTGKTAEMLATGANDGAVGRNTFSGPGIGALDLALLKSIRLSERHNAIVRVEAFNVFNRANFGVPVRILEAPAFGASTNTRIPARMLQIALKYSF
jgi:hypothetical protein